MRTHGCHRYTDVAGIYCSIGLLWAFVCFAANVLAQTPERVVSSPLPSYEVKRTTASIAIDGRVDEPAWRAAEPVTLQFPWDSQTGAKQKTTVRLLWNADFLFVAYECEDTDIVAHHEQRDDPTYEDDAVEIFIQPNPKHPIYVGLEINARAVLFDYIAVHRQALVKSYDIKGVQLASRLDGTLNLTSDRDNGWTLELAIPLRQLAELSGGKSVGAGTTWGANINRLDGTEPHRRLSVWSDSATVVPTPHNPARFGRLVFAP